MDIAITQENLVLKIQTALGENTLLVHKLTGNETIFSPFEFVLDLYSSSTSLDFSQLLGTEVVVSLESLDDQESPSQLRYFCGIVGKIEQNQTITDDDDDLTSYKAFIYPSLWLLKFTQDCRIFQNKKTIDIITTILNENGVTKVDNLVSSCGQNVREYCVQYDESCFDFISRLMEEEGIFYFFTHSASGHKLVLADDNSSFKPLPKATISLNSNQVGPRYLNTIYQFTMQQQIVVGSFQMVDYNYLTPLTSLQPSVSGTGTGGRVYEYPGRFKTLSVGESLSTLRIQALEWPNQLCHGNSTVYAFSAGQQFTLEDHPRDNFNDDYILYRVSHQIVQNYNKSASFEEKETLENLTPVYTNEFSAFPETTPFRPLRKTFKPRIHSNQTAVVTGPAGEEVYCDKYGRIKVKFFWDLSSTTEDKTSCWIRVAQNWAGTNWGGLVTPRIGMEVVVTYIDGDPDRPLVIGCVYNADHTAPDYTTSSPTKSTFKSNTSKGGGGFNEIRFEDAKGSEEIYMQAQKDWNNLIKDSRTEHIIKGDDTLTMDKGDKTEIQNGSGTVHSLQIKDGDNEIKIKKGNYSLTLKKGDSSTTLNMGDCSFSLKLGDFSCSLDMGDYSIKLSNGNLKIKVNGKINIKSTDDISIESDKNR